MYFLATMYSSWDIEKKPEFNVLEIGAGSCDLMNEIFTIRDEVLASESSTVFHKAFFKSLKFNIVDFPQMIAIQQEKLGKNAKEVNFIPLDISKDLLKKASFDFIYGNEIPDTQRVDFLEVKKEKDGNKKYFMRALKTSESGETTEVLAGLSSTPELIAEIGKNLYPIDELEPGVYKLQFGFHALMHNIKQSLKPPHGTFILSDYFTFYEDLCCRDLTFAGTDGSSLIERNQIIDIGEPGKQLIKARELYATPDVTYGPQVGKDTCKSFGCIVTSFNFGDDEAEDGRGKVIANLKFSESFFLKSKQDILFGKQIKDIVRNLQFEGDELMKTELTKCTTAREISPYKDPFSSMIKALDALQLSDHPISKGKGS